MNIRLQKYKVNRLAGMSIYNAARAAGYSENYARNARPEKLVKGCLADAFEQAGLTDKAIVVHALKGLVATKLQTCDVYLKDENGTYKINKNSNDFIEVEDWNARHRYFETILKLTDKLREKIEHSGEIKGNQTNIVVIRPETKPNGNQTQAVPGRFPV